MPRKKHLVGFETELFLLEDNGAISSRADDFLEAGNKLRLKYPIHKEYTHNMVEIASVANFRVRKGAWSWLETIEKLIELGKRMDIRLFPYGTYFGNHIPTARQDDYYRMCESVLGPAKYAMSTGRVAGFHFHYCLPYGVFDSKKRLLRQLFRSKYKEDFLNLYNIMIAMDPAVTNFMESSPFLDGMHHVKDSRIMIYRDMRLRGNADYVGLYSDYSLFGGLPRYAAGLSDVIMLTEHRYATWKELVTERCPVYEDIVGERHPLQFNWGPLRINKVGTFEYRGLDMNLPSHIVGTSLLMKYLMKRIREEHLEVRPSDIGIREPFKVEGNYLYVPPFSYVNDVLQARSAIEGMDDPLVYRYSKAFAAACLKSVPHKRDPGVDRIKRILSTRKTKSDEILDRAKKLGWEKGDRLSEEMARDLALEAAEELEDEVERMMRRELLIDIPSG